MIYTRTKSEYIGSGPLQVHLFFDTMADFSSLPGLTRTAPGSTAYGPVIGGDAQFFILSGESGSWEAQ